MPELIRSIATRLREFVGNRRRAPRFRIRLELELSPMASSPGSNSKTVLERLSLSGHTRDISATGLAVVIPTIRVGGKYLTGSNETLCITLSLPAGPVQIYGLPVRYSPLEENSSDRGYLVGVQIDQMSTADRSRFSEFVQSLREQ